MDGNKMKEGVSIKQIEGFARKHKFEVFLCITLALACFFSFIMWGVVLAMMTAIAGAIISILIPAKTAQLSKKICQFALKQEQTTQIVLAIVTFILAICIPPLIFLSLGLHGGRDLLKTFIDNSQKPSL